MSGTVVYALIIALLCAGALMLSPGESRLSAAAGRVSSALLYPRGWLRAGRQLGNQVTYALTSSGRKERMDREIFDAISAVRNIIAASGGVHIPADALFEQLARNNGTLAPLFRRALPLLRVNRREEMARRFAEDAGTTMAGDFIRVLIRWDDVSPEKLSSTLLSYQSAIKEARTTALKRRNEIYSDLIYFPAVLNVLVVLMNFIFVSYYIEQRDLFEKLFF
ncbi:MAG: hypothetical protein LBT52_00045 [Clostridiales Family XIII bacterium]|jgi:hypothetical protein|nr:hypothetical protein [Clostridiales Family XIII bacterium]